MGIKRKFGDNYVRNQVEKFQNNLDTAIILTLAYLGEELAKYAKDNHNYTDRTGNLTNSIGYAVLRDGHIVQSGGFSNVEPTLKSMDVIKKLVDSNPKRYVLVIAAGMEYAAYVEAKGYNVILPAYLKALTDYPIKMKELYEKAKKMAREKYNLDLS